MAQEEAKTDTSKRGWLEGVTLKPVTKAWQTATFGSPLVGAAYTAAGLALAGYHFTPWFKRQFRRLFSPALTEADRKALEENEPVEGSEEDKSERKTWAAILGLLGGATVLGLNYRPGEPGAGLTSYHPMEGIAKKNSGELGGALPLGQCTDMIRYNTELEPYVKGQCLNLLNSFNAPPTQMVNGGDLIGQAIATGQSAATGLGIGWLTAKVLGLPNPKSTAILGAVANTLGPWSALATSLAFGR